MYRGIVAAVTAAAVMSGVGAGWAQNFGAPLDRFFRLEWEVAKGRQGRPAVIGYIYNDRGLRADNVRLLVEELDASGRAVGSTIGYVNGDLPARGRAFFEVPVPTAGATYRVTVHSFDWRDGGPSARRLPGHTG